MNKSLKKIIILSVVNLLFVMPVLALDLDSTVNDKSRQNYSSANTAATQQTQQATTAPKQAEVKPVEIKPEIKQDLPSVPSLPSKAHSSTSSPINTVYSGKMPNSDALIPCTDIKVGSLIIDESIYKSKSTSKSTRIASAKTSSSKYRGTKLAKGTQFRVINQTKINDYLTVGQNIVFITTQDLYTPYFTIPKNSQLNARIVDVHRPQMTCNGGLVKIRLVSANINGAVQQMDGGIIKLRTDNVYFNNLKGKHCYGKNVCQKAKWGKTKFKEWSKTSKELANEGPLIIISPFPYIGGCLAVAGSTIASPLTALFGKGEPIAIPPNTAFTLKLYSDAQIRY